VTKAYLKGEKDKGTAIADFKKAAKDVPGKYYELLNQ